MEKILLKSIQYPHNLITIMYIKYIEVVERRIIF